MFDWLSNLFLPNANPGVPQSLLVICVAVALGIALGRIRVRGVAIGVAGVMFAGIFLGHLGYRLQTDTLFLLRDIGLILFVYAVGLQVGPSFFSSFRQEGLLFNALAAGTVLCGALLTIAVMKFSGISPDNMAGIMSGAVTNTPGLGAAKNTLGDMARANPGMTFSDPANGYAIAYPFGAIGVILTLLLGKRLFGIDTRTEITRFEAERRLKYPHPENRTCRVTNPEAFGKTIREIVEATGGHGFIVSRLKHSGTTTVMSPSPDIVLSERDVLMIVGLPEELEQATRLLGRESTDQIILSQDDVVAKNFIVTKKVAVQRSLAQLNLEGRYGIRVTRIFRAGMEFVATPGFVLHFGDTLRVVGPPAALEYVQKILGNSAKRLLEPELLSVFLGIALGLVAGSIPLFIPGLKLPVKIGLAAGPLLVAILISRYGGMGRLHSFMSQSATLFMRDFGICLFFSTVGISAGQTFYKTFVGYNGWSWVAYGMLISLVPQLLLFAAGRVWFRINFLQLAGIMGGAHTSPPTLTFSTAFLGSDVPAQAYATVFPLVTILRILIAQLFILYTMQ